MKKIWFLLGLAIILVLPMSVVLANVSNPHIVTPWTSGNAGTECGSLEALGYGSYSYGVKFEHNAPDDDDPNEVYANSQKTVSGNTITITYVDTDPTVTQPNSFNWSSTTGVGTVIVKAGNGANVWVYNPQEYRDSGLYAYENRGISHITFCWNEGQKQASASVEVLGCQDPNAIGTEPVKISATGVIVKVYSNSGKTDPYLELTHDPDTNINPSTYTTLAAGTYYLGYQALDGYVIPAEDPDFKESFTIVDCGGKKSADAYALVQGCEDGDETEPAEIYADGVDIKIYKGPGETNQVGTHTPTTVPNPKTFSGWEVGTYYLVYDLLDGYELPQGGLQPKFDIAPCTKETTEAYAEPLGCSAGDVSEPVEIYAKGVTIKVFGDSGLTDLRITHDPSTDTNPGTYEGLGQGTYYMDYEPLLGYEIPEDGLKKTFDIGLCDSEKSSATASITLGACGWTVEDGSLVPVDIALTNAKLTLDGKVYEPKSLVKTSVLAAAIDNFEGKYAITLRPGNYAYTWESIDPEVYVGSGNGTLVVKPCDPKEDKQPDLPSSGSAPSLINTAAPFLLSIMEIGLAWNFLDVKIKKNR